MDYLAPGGTIYVGVSSVHEDWADEMKRDLTWELDGRLGSDIHISADPKPDESPESGTAREAETAFPASPPVSETVPAAVQTAPAAHQTVPTAHPNDNWNEDSDEQRDEDGDGPAHVPKKLGILILFSSAMDLTMKFGALPMYVLAPMKTAPAEMASNMIWDTVPTEVVIPWVAPRARQSGGRPGMSACCPGKTTRHRLPKTSATDGTGPVQRHGP